ncbi:uncharacterized protein LOC120627494 [Pararge aegeria]|uniref:Jg20652 protein n=1 Tax=Pararge aegeria aegeria TaxID=348720 RepID=A0A8S4REJ9_9NEOP|nr:uncharacterized protein LOC120627494 [Pararge aegeria]CAH2233676.1 jg20652 [Pararge aegeria aegeria]
MALGKNSKLLCGLLICLINSASPTSDAGKPKLTTNTAYEGKSNPNNFATIFSPRMDFDQWKPLTGRGDPLRNDPTYDYEPPVLEKVHYWADDSRIEREKNSERKSEVLVLGISSRKPSVASRPPMPPRRHTRPPTFPSQYEDFSYKFGNNFPMTILVPPPPPPPGHNPSLFVISQEKVLIPTPPSRLENVDVTAITRDTTTVPELVTSYALQEANLVYEASTTKQNWFHDYNKTTNFPNNTVSSDYAGWGPTTPFEDVNDSHNMISYKDHHNIEFTKEPLFYYKPMLSEAPPPPRAPTSSLILSTFLPTALPPTQSNTEETWPSRETTLETTTETTNYYTETTTEKIITETVPSTPRPLLKPKPNMIDMLGSMISMPMVTDPDRPEDNLYAHASDTIQIFKEPSTEDLANLEIMQTMQPPPVKFPENTTPHLIGKFNVKPHDLNNMLHEKPVMHTHDPYLHMRYTTPMSATVAPSQADIRSTTEAQLLPTYLIIQGHSKVKTYGSKPKISGTITNEIPHPNETTEVKHLHPIKDKHAKKSDKTNKNREARTQNLRSLLDNGLGSIEIQETDVGIKYDVSDGSEVPVEIYRKGIVDNDENNYSKSNIKENRNKRQIDLDTILSFDEDSLEDLVYNFFNNKKNETGMSGLIAQAIADSSKSIENIENDNDQEENTNR